MNNWRNRKRIHWDGNDKCIRLTENYSIGFDTYAFEIFFSNLFRYKKDNQSWQNGSLWWKTLSFNKKILDKHYGLRKFLTLHYGHYKHPYHGVNNIDIRISFIPVTMKHYFDAKDLDINVSDSCKSQY